MLKASTFAHEAASFATLRSSSIRLAWAPFNLFSARRISCKSQKGDQSSVRSDFRELMFLIINHVLLQSSLKSVFCKTLFRVHVSVPPAPYAAHHSPCRLRNKILRLNVFKRQAFLKHQNAVLRRCETYLVVRCRPRICGCKIKLADSRDLASGAWCFYLQ